MKKFYVLFAMAFLALVSLNAQLTVKWGDTDNYTIETELVDGNYLGPNNSVYFWENGSQHQFVVIHGIDKYYASGQDYNEFYLYVRVTGTQTYSDGQGGEVIGPRVNEDGYPIGIPGFDCCYSSSEYIPALGSSYYGVFYYYGADEFLVGWANTKNGYYGDDRCNLSSFLDETNGFNLASITTGKLVVLQAADGTMAAQWIKSDGKAGIVIGEGGVSSKVDVPLTSNLVYSDNTGADTEWRYLQLAGTGVGSDNNSYDAAFYVKTGSVTGTFSASDLDLSQTYLKQNGTVVEWPDVTLTITETSTRIYALTATFTGTDGKTYNVTATYENCPPVAATIDPFAFANTELVNSEYVASGSKSTIYYLDWYRDGEYDGNKGKRPCTRLVFCFYKSDMRYVNGKVYPPDGTYTFSSASNVPVWSVAAYRWVFSNTGYYSMYYDENYTKYYLNSGSVTVETKSDGVYVTINARGGTGTTSTNKSFNITIVPKFSVSASGYKLNTYVNGRGSVAVSPDECLYAAGETITLTPTPDNSDWTFSGWTGVCANQITDNGDGAYTYTVPANDCAVIANFTEGASYDVTFINYDLQVLQQGKVKKDDVPVYTGKTPEHAQDERFTYTFSGWSNGNNFYGKDEALPAVTQEITYTAQYIQEERLYTVIFINYDNEELWRGGFAYNVAASYGGETPTKPEDEDYAYVFSGWTDGTNTYGVNDILPAVTTDDVVYTAVFEQEPLELHIVLIEDEDADYYNWFSDKYNGRRATTVTLNRQFTQGKWATLCLPFDVSTALITSQGMMNRVYEFKYTKGNEEDGLTLYFAQAKRLEAGKGYIVNANATMAKKTSFVFPGVVVNTEADINSGFDIANLEGYNTQGTVYLVGTLRTGLLLGSETGTRYMGLKDNKIYYPNSEQGTSVRAYRGIFRNTEDMQVSRVRIIVESEDGEQISELEVVNGALEDAALPKKVMRNGILYIQRNGELFDAQGQKVE